MCAALGSAWAEETSPVSAGLDLSVLSSYVFRGQVLNDKAVVQPSLTVSKSGFALNTWANYNLDGSYSGDNEHEFSELDLTASYSKRVGPVNLGVGVVQYTFPNQVLTVSDETTTTQTAYPATREVYVSVGLPDVVLAPTLTVYRDFDTIAGFYATLALSQSFKVTEKASVVVSASVGAGDKDYNQGYFGQDKTALNDVVFGLALLITATDCLTIKPAIGYVFLPDSSISDAADEVYGNKDSLIGSLTLSYAF